MRTFPDLPLATERLVLRPPRPDDAAALFAIHADPEVMRYWATPPWTDPRMAEERIAGDLERIAEGTALRLHLEPAGGGPILGAVTLFAFVEPSARAETGYILAREAWGRGYAQEAMGALLDYGFTALGLRRIEADIDPRNSASARLLERLGFTREGCLRERWQVGDEVSDTALYGLLAREWRGSRRTTAVDLDHLIVPTKDRVASARLLGTLLGVPWAEQAKIGPFSPVFVNDGLTVDFDQWTDPVPKQHYCFRVDPVRFEAILGRIKAAGLPFRSGPFPPDDYRVNEAFGGKLVYWSEPDGHAWEILTVSYARSGD